LSSLRPIAVAAAALLLAAAVRAAEISPSLASRYSINGAATPSAAAQPFTLFDPGWVLPSVEALETAEALASGSERATQLLRSDATPADAAPSAPTGEHPVGYSLSDDLTAQFKYHHAELFDRADSQTLRDDTSTAFSTRPDRDVLDLNMSWKLAGSTVGLGYEFQTARSGGGDIGITRLLPGNQQATHSFTLGLSREWGASAPPVLIEPPWLPPLDVAEADATPTPVP